MRAKRYLLCLIVAFTARGAAPSTETFDSLGSDMMATRFSALLLAGDGTFVREVLDGSSGAPDTEPALPVNQGGDKELRYSEVSLAATSSFALTPAVPGGVFTDMQVDAVLSLGLNELFGAPSGGLVLRASGDSRSTLDAYAATITVNTFFDPTTVVLTILRFDDGVGHGLVTSDAFELDPDLENLHLTFRAQGSELEARVWRVRVDGGQIVEVPVDLDASTEGAQNTLATSDALLAEGRLGLVAFTRHSNHILFDDVSLDEEVFLDDFETGDLTLWTRAAP